MFDTNVLSAPEYQEYIGVIGVFFLSAVVVQELLANRDQEAQKRLIKSANELDLRRRLVVPSKEDWCEVGKCLQRLFVNGVKGRRFTKEYVNCLVRDALIARCAMRVEAQLITANTDDFDRIKSVFKGLKHITPSAYFGTRPR